MFYYAIIEATETPEVSTDSRHRVAGKRRGTRFGHRCLSNVQHVCPFYLFTDLFAFSINVTAPSAFTDSIRSRRSDLNSRTSDLSG